jgi:hypothetical protein
MKGDFVLLQKGSVASNEGVPEIGLMTTPMSQRQMGSSKSFWMD